VIRLSDGRGSASLSTLIAVFVAGSLVGALAAVEVVPANRVGSAVAVGPDGNGVTNDGTSSTTTNANGTPKTGPAASGAPVTTKGNGKNGGTATTVVAPSKFQCRAGANGGATDRGVTATEIHLATTIVASGPGASFLGEMKYAMQAVATQVNNSGGICGRRLTIGGQPIQTRDDGWVASDGARYLRNYIQDKNIFAIPVGASSEGLRVVVDSGDLDRAQFPAVGTDGLAINQYAKSDGSAQQWVWPIATATVSSARIMAEDAVKRGAKSPGVVFDNNYRFGKEAAAAFSAEIKRLTGQSVAGTNSQNTCNERYCGIPAAQPSYSGDAQRFYGAKPDYVAMFLEPDTALTWMLDQNTPAATSKDVPYGYGAAQPLFTKQFESQCRAKCDQMVVWSGFKPFVEKYKNDPAVIDYVRALKGTNRQADEYNQFTQSAYVGMQFFVAALRAVGPELTRARLKQVLDHMVYTDGLTLQGTLRMTPLSRFANITMQAFTMQYKGTPGLWRLGTIRRDPRPQVD
jgi:ABC-type branched-subunit amino acid transport system substrate-binding protein